VSRLVLDTDLALGSPGSEIDDGFALALAVADRDLDLELVTTVHGNIDVASATALTGELLDRLGRTDIPVVRGAAAPLLRPGAADGVPPRVADLVAARPPAPGYAAVEIARHVMSAPGEVTLLAVGPLTNVAVALALEPDLAHAVRQIVLMGGVYTRGTNQHGMPGEFNVWVDPEAAAAVFASGAPVRAVGLDVTLQVRLTRQHAEAMRSGPGRFGPYAGDCTLAWIDHMRERHPGDPDAADSCAMHDPLAVAAVSHPELLTWRPARVHVVTDSQAARGMTVADLLTTADAPEANCQIAVGVDVPRFMSYLTDHLSRV
jgi:purine nucleosidase